MTKVCETSIDKKITLRQDKTNSINYLFNNNQKVTAKRAFSLIELLVVILILGLLVGLVAPQVIGQGNEAQRKLACTQMGAVKQALKMFKLDNGTYPETDEGLEALVANPDADKYPNYSGAPYLEKLPKDSWGSALTYIKDGGDFKLVSFGADRKEGGEDEGTDIVFPDCQK
ncbi:MAG: type II secretion system major pseudopilin GspG [Epsilonproteobacteria bacterium]|nr:type II secretion system major pseudopilin GspG [Campylobacterota bacterium]